MSSNEEFKIQPHPQDNHSNAPIGSGPTGLAEGAHSANPGPRILDNESASKLEKPKSKEEMAKISASLNQDDQAPPTTTETQPEPQAKDDDLPSSKQCCTCM